MGNIPDANMRPNGAIMCHTCANVDPCGAKAKPQMAQISRILTIIQAEGRGQKAEWGKFESLISKYETTSNFQRPEIQNYLPQSKLTTEDAEDADSGLVYLIVNILFWVL